METLHLEIDPIPENMGLWDLLRPPKRILKRMFVLSNSFFEDGIYEFLHNCTYIQKGIGKGTCAESHLISHSLHGTFLLRTIVSSSMSHVENEINIYERIYSSENNEEYVSRLLYADIPVITHDIGVSYFLFEYKDGTTLQNYLRHVSFSKEEAICLVQHMMNIVSFIHSLGILHRDIKPNNMFLPKGSLKPIVFDFGVSCFSDSSTSSEFMGSRKYAHPDSLLFFSKTCSIYNSTIKYDTYSVKTIAVHDILPCVRTQDHETFLTWLHQQIPEPHIENDH